MYNNRKNIVKLLILVLLISLLQLPLTACASDTSASTNDISVYINNDVQHFSPSPVIKSGSTLVPMRSFFEALGAEIDWDADTKTVKGKRDETTVSLTIGSKTAYVDGKSKTLSVPAQLINNSTFIPLRFVGEALGDKVEYIQDTKTIKITTAFKSAAPKASKEEASKEVSKKEKLKVHYIDVGQGDSILIQFPSGQSMLIDAGEDTNTVTSYLKSQGVKRIDHVIATHPHADHIGGMANVINSFEIGNVYMPRTTHTTKTYENLLLAIKNKGLKINAAKAGLNIDVGFNVKAQMVAPNSQGYDDLNNYSAVLRVQYGDTSFLFTGDAEAVSENEMINSGYTLKSDVLKVGHHGSNTSTTSTFLKSVSPKYAVISSGKGNKYGHPHQEVLARLNNAGVKVYRTDEVGTVIAESDSKTITFNKQSSQIKERAPTTPKPVPAPTTPSSGKYIGNKNSKKLHLPSCRSLPAPKNRVFFNSREEAINSGYVPCKICKP